MLQIFRVRELLCTNKNCDVELVQSTWRTRAAGAGAGAGADR